MKNAIALAGRPGSRRGRSAIGEQRPARLLWTRCGAPRGWRFIGNRQRDEREGARAGEVDKRPGLGLVIEGAEQDPVGGEDREREREHQEQPVPGFAPEAQEEERDGVGALTGFFGVGGGFVIVPMLTLWFGVTFRRAVATSLVIITLTGVAALASHLAAGATPDLPITAALAGSTAVGAPVRHARRPAPAAACPRTRLRPRRRRRRCVPARGHRGAGRSPGATEAFEPSSRRASCRGRESMRLRPPVRPSFSWQVRPTSATRSSPACGRCC